MTAKDLGSFIFFILKEKSVNICINQFNLCSCLFRINILHFHTISFQFLSLLFLFCFNPVSHRVHPLFILYEVDLLFIQSLNNFIFIFFIEIYSYIKYQHAKKILLNDITNNLYHTFGVHGNMRVLRRDCAGDGPDGFNYTNAG